MNCKPGDIAKIVHPSMYGTLVDILYAEPNVDYTLPDGYHAYRGRNTNGWVFKFIGAPRRVPVGGGTRLAYYAACGDRWLRPIRPDEGEDETLSWKSVPNTQDKVSA